MNRSLQELATPPAWISKPLYAMTPDELRDLRAALCRESPPDVALLRAVDGRLALFAPTLAPPPIPPPIPTLAPPPADRPRPDPDGADEDEDDDAWALDG
ncbi:hypothetical protein ACQP1W_48365 [Spirillospora sp. CA-255316]